MDRLPEEAPPLIVAVVGPPQVGKTTLIKSMVRRYTKQTLSNPIGPLTVVTSKRRRLTFIECPSDSLAAMIDIAKVVDIVLLMIDGKYGFEMETMEFLNVLSASGMPGNVFGILTKLDLFKKQDTLRAQKKRLKHRFWSELYQGAKLFYLSGVVNGRYPDREILNLSRFLSVMKNPRPLIWRNSHPYCLADRFLDITAPTDIEQNPKCDRTIALYGYLRGTNFPAYAARVHIPGVGDLSVSNIEALPDPCPTPFVDQAIAKATGKTSRKRLGEKQKVLFAPMSDVGGVLVDKDAVYINVRTSTFDPDGPSIEDRGLGEQLVLGLQADKRLLGETAAGVRLFGGTDVTNGLGGATTHESNQERRPAVASDVPTAINFQDGSSDEDEAYVSAEGDDSDMFSENDEAMVNPVAIDSVRGNADLTNAESTKDEFAFADSDSDMGSLSSFADHGLGKERDENSSVSGEEDDGALQWKDNLAQKAKASHGNKIYGRTVDLARLMYDMSLTTADAIRKWNGSDDITSSLKDTMAGNKDDDFFKRKQDAKDDEVHGNRMTPQYEYEELQRKWTDEENLKGLRQRFTSARLKSQTDGNDDDRDNSDVNDSDDAEDEGDGDFEDLEIGEGDSRAAPIDQQVSIEAEREKNARKKEELKLRFEEEDKEGFGNDKTNSRRKDRGQEEAEFGEDDWYDAQKAKIQKQLDINRTEFAEMDEQSRVTIAGYKAGTYARIVLEKVPYEFSVGLKPESPIIIGGLNSTEDRFGFVQVRIKRHRWHQKILKTNDPLIFSLGWRRFQTVPIYSMHENRMRNRMLKYTPEHMHCFGTFYGPLIAPNTGFCCVQSFSNRKAGFRVAATGVVLNVDESTEIVKKLKLKGYPHKIYKNTAIIKDMFGSELEIAKFKSGNLRTVSGVRGMIKGRAGNKYPDGYVRAGFEDKILMSDIVFLSAWRLVKPREFYMPVTNLLLAPGKNIGNDAEWEGMRLTGEVRLDEGMKTPKEKNSTYRPVERPTRHFNPLRVPRKLAADLPFKSQIAHMKPQRNETYMQKRAVVLGGEEKRVRDLMQKLSTLRNEKVAKRAAAQEKRREPYRKRIAENLEKKTAREKREKDEYWRREGKKRKNDGAEAGGGKRQKKK